jgi:acyl-CoA dehydrogenase
MTYRAPINDMLLALNHGAGLQAAVKAGHYGDFDADITAAVLEEAGRFASDVLAPLNRVGDENGIKLLAARACLWRSMRPAPRSGARRTSRSASARC